MKRSIRVLAVLLCCAVALATVAYAASYSKTLTAYYRDIKLSVNGQTVTPKDVNGKVVDPFIVDGTTYLPVRAVSEALGKKVEWNDKTSTVTITDQPAGLVGTWKAVKTSTEGEDKPMKESFPKGLTITLKSDHTATAAFSGETFNVDWKEDNGALTIIWDDAVDSPYNWYGTVTGNVMTLFLEAHEGVGWSLVTLTK